MSRAITLLAVLLLACTRSAANHEELGDRSYAAGAYADALAEYQLGRRANAGSATLLAKLAAAAMHTEDYDLAAESYRTLAQRDRSRAEEAADGLDRVARAALAANDRTALASALTGLREIAPRRPLGRYVALAALDAVDRSDTAEARALLPVAAATAVDAARADSLLFVYGMTLVRVRECSTAVRVFEGVVRRQRAVAVVESAREGLGLCALVAGQIALEQGHPADAEGWFRRAHAGTRGGTGRRGRLSSPRARPAGRPGGGTGRRSCPGDESVPPRRFSSRAGDFPAGQFPAATGKSRTGGSAVLPRRDLVPGR